jgi:hypothetical protein
MGPSRATTAASLVPAISYAAAGVPFEMQMVSYAGDANQLWDNVCGKAHGGVCSSSAA